MFRRLVLVFTFCSKALLYWIGPSFHFFFLFFLREQKKKEKKRKKKKAPPTTPFTKHMLRVTYFICLMQVASALGDPHSDFDCKFRTLGVEFAAFLQPFRSPSSFKEILDAFQGSAADDCIVGIPNITSNTSSRFFQRPLTVESAGTITVYVDPVHGSDDTGNGAIDSPFKSLPPALAATRASPGAGDTILIRNGTLYNASTLVLNTGDRGLTVASYPGEEAWLSGGIPLNELTWAPWNINLTIPWEEVAQTSAFHDWEFGGPSSFKAPDAENWEACQSSCVKNSSTAAGSCAAWTWFDLNSGTWSKGCWWRVDGQAPMYAKGGCVSGRKGTGKNIWSASLVGLGIKDIPGLRLNGGRLVRARYPNTRSPERDGFLPPAVFRANSWTHPENVAPEVQIDLPPSMLLRNTSVTMFQTFTAGIGGICDHPITGFQPGAGYWCSKNVQGGESGIFSSPTAMQVDTTVLPHLPYLHPETAVVQTWREGHWASWMYTVDSVAWENCSSASPSPCWGNFSFSRGGFQGSRGDWNGEDSYIENVFEELVRWVSCKGSRLGKTLFLSHHLRARAPEFPPPTPSSITQPTHRTSPMNIFIMPALRPCTSFTMPPLGPRLLLRV